LDPATCVKKMGENGSKKKESRVYEFKKKKTGRKKGEKE